MRILQSARCLRHGWFWSSAAKVPCKMPWTGTPIALPSSFPVLVSVIAAVANASCYLVAHAMKAVMHLPG